MMVLLTAFAIIVLFISAIWSLNLLSNWNHDDREPPLVPQKVPLIGHVLNLLRGPVQYYAKLGYVLRQSLCYCL